MSDVAVETLAWDATPRDRALTRGLLHGLGRPRGQFFIVSLPKEIVVGLLTLGLRPLWIAGVRIDRWRRYEWLLLGDFARWWHARTGDAEALALVATADRLARPKASWSAAAICCVVALLLAIGAVGFATFAMTRGPQALSVVVVEWIAASIGVALGFQLATLEADRNQAWSRAWFGRLSRSLIAHDHRPVPVARVRIGNDTRIGLIVGMLFFPLALIAGLRHHNAVVRSFREPKLRLVERMLERMDASEWQVEYDVESMRDVPRV